jgi:hypothetical protein
MVRKYCRVVETEVDIENGKCQKQSGAPTMRTTCPYKNSLVCPEKELFEDDSNEHLLERIEREEFEIKFRK